MAMESAVLVEALRKCQDGLVEVIGGLVGFADSLPQGATRDHLFDKISSLDSIADVMRQALDAWPGSANADQGKSL
jgi:hypothetical protein